ncbi:TlpA family protein disulfide reductase [Paramagnetospirillum magneticum]|uniref:Thiol-disulfide isomerase and thioredoxins n=1 Tax=Paramagnetospirillum magneticum (strain ATCC 700264 / AMB-1) TaxID=342108 RepID=Q2W2N3_PARM1|nr:TlpA disulfide reductase family protein [Paramagnetospirillum magneticum]BAE51892.1 Thiol-disulfide isomerase and thioredoxins [Paramagnetospirillum magneticum AMB-1]
MKRRAFILSAAALAAMRTLPARAASKSLRGLVIHDRPQPVPAIEIRDAESRPAGLDTLKGKPILLNLWASWCMPCVAELPALDRLKPALGAKGVALVALSLDRGGKVAVTNTFARLGIKNLDIRTDENRVAAEKLDAPALPVTLLIDAEGREVARFIGAAEWDGPQAARLMDALAAGSRLTPDMAPPPVRLGTAP